MVGRVQGIIGRDRVGVRVWGKAGYEMVGEHVGKK